MSIAVRDLSTLDPVLVQANLDEMAVRLQEANPNLDLRRGVLYDLLLYYHSVLAAAQQTNINDYLRARSMLDLIADPALADPDLTDAVLSNFRLTRQPGAAARGEITIVRTVSTSMTVAVGAVFESRGLTFVTESAFTAKMEPELINSPTDRIISPLSDGNYAFTIDVVAVLVGEAGRLAKDTLIVPQVTPSGYVTSYATSDFRDGAASETNAELVSRLQQGISCKAPSNRVNMMAMLREIEVFARVQDVSIIGYGDLETDRDRHWIFPVSGGGRMDWYVRSQPALDRVKITKEAVLTAQNGDSSVWRISLDREEAAGVYEIANIRPTDSDPAAGGFEILSDVRGLDKDASGYIVDVETAVEATYSRYQTILVWFVDTRISATTLAVGTKQEYQFEIRRTPLIAAIQDYLNQRGVRCFGADVLIKAAVPCFVQIGVSVALQAQAATPDVPAIQEAVAAYVNSIGFTGRIYASQIYNVVQNFLTDAASAYAIDLFGRLRYPDGRTSYVRSDEALIVPEDPADYVSANTVQFYIAPEDVVVSVSVGIPVPL